MSNIQSSSQEAAQLETLSGSIAAKRDSESAWSEMDTIATVPTKDWIEATTGNKLASVGTGKGNFNDPTETLSSHEHLATKKIATAEGDREYYTSSGIEPQDSAL